MTSLTVDIEDNPMDVELETLEVAPAVERHWTLPIKVTVPIANLALIPEGEDYVGRVVLFVAARDTRGGESELQRQQHEVRVRAADYDVARTRRFSIDLQLLMAEGRQRVAIAMMDQVTRQASYQNLTVSIP